MNGAQLPNWTKLVAVGFALASVWFANQNTVHELQRAQIEITKAIGEVRLEMRERLVTNAEFAILRERVESNARRLDALETRMGIRH